MSTTVLKEGQPGSKAALKDSYLLHKLHSLSGVIPIGAFMVFHLTMNAYSLRGDGEAAFNTVVKAIGYAPFVMALEVVAIFVPILFHAIYGFVIIRSMQNIAGNVVHYGGKEYVRNYLYTLQRWSGVVAFAYLVFHTVDTTIFKYWWENSHSHEQGLGSISYAAMAFRFSHVWYLLVYLIGIAAAAFHLGNGLFSFAIRWGLAIGKSAQRNVGILGALVFLGLTGLGWLIAGNFALKWSDYAKEHPEVTTMEQLVKLEVAKVGASSVKNEKVQDVKVEGVK
jgi:succinate dehydrogenase / fumarate reductase, cytochrome b subunit